MDSSQNTKRIAKNTLLLYLRMIIITIVSFYTTRLTLQILGVEDFGIRNVICGITSFIGVVTTAMVNASQRFLAYDLGTSNSANYQSTFSMLVNVFLFITVAGIILLELIGPFCISKYLVIPDGRMYAAQWIYQFTIVGFVVSTMVVPYTSSIIVHEKMNIFAYISLFDAIVKLFVLYLLYITTYDKLIVVVLLTTTATIMTSVLYVIYCHRSFKECRYIKCWDKGILKKLLSFMGWNMFGSLTSIMNVQGQAILLNIFFGPIINAAKAIADSVQSLVQQFVSNFYLAVGPQIVKSYAAEDYGYTTKIVLMSSKFATYLLCLLCIPIIFNMKPLLCLWLGADSVSDIMVLFAQWSLAQTLAQSMDYPITQTVRATGDIKKYQIYIGVQTLSFIPLCYIAFKLGFPAITSMIILTSIYVLVQLSRVKFLTSILNIKYSDYYCNVVFPLVFVLILCFGANSILKINNDTFGGIIISLICSFIVCLCVILLFGMKKVEREYALQYILKMRNRRSNK